ncbi:MULTISPECIES: DNA endonuclease [unclassified Bacillus (in: firmicutes)]|uniref:DNA endonuclease n=1 Tax=unclassified Bacillus (in: firmicutes) TaxID=185979 RepID=UPI001BEA54BF|nr:MULTISPECIES: DNA endonuclease [unclassified Bacillus (in: firmicutes)]MBT2615156.1 DNA endonuclease [Bacillus sp. ISL-78]MBT2628231.1 DNA endonuclease [Bacillus sp. ISL-101]
MIDLTDIQKNILYASIISDGEITKIYKNSRRKNNSYREHYGTSQEAYRKWKISFFDGLLYITPASQCVRSASLELFTDLFPHFYSNDGTKHLPFTLLKNCTLPHFLTILYMDDGSLSISYRVNHNKKIIYLTPHIYLYLQCYPKDELEKLKEHRFTTYHLSLKLSARKDGYGYILKTTSVKETFRFLELIEPVAKTCSSMLYKTSWEFRNQKEILRWKSKYPDYTILTSSSDRSKPYSPDEIKLLRQLKENGYTTNEIAKMLKRSYWSVTHKWQEIKKLT